MNRKETFFGNTINLGNLSDGPGRAFIDGFIKEGSDAYFEMKHFYEMTKDKHCLFDVGCAVGAFSLVFCYDDNRIAHAFDASHVTQLHIIQNIALNPSKRISYHKIFLGDANMIRPYYSDNIHALAIAGNDRVVMIKMDVFCNLTNTTPDVIKIDTEGFEYNVLLGGKNVITQCRPLMFIELHPKFTQMYGTKIEQVFELAKEFNYSIRDLEDSEVTLESLMKLNVESLRTTWVPK